jgi:hypothetical protein
MSKIDFLILRVNNNFINGATQEKIIGATAYGKRRTLTTTEGSSQEPNQELIKLPNHNQICRIISQR